MVSVHVSETSGPALSVLLYSCERHFTLTLSLSTQVYKWVLANLVPGCEPEMD